MIFKKEEYYNRYLNYMHENNFFDLIYYFNNKKFNK